MPVGGGGRRRAPHPSTVVVIVVVLTLLPLAAAWVALAGGWQPTGDVATIGLRARDVGTTDSPLQGQSTTGANLTKVDTWHPGPAEFYVLAPFVRILGPRAGLLVGSAVVNAAAILATLVFAWRRGGSVLVVLAGVAMALLARSLGAASLSTAYNADFATYLAFAAIMALWSMVDGDLAAAPCFVVAWSIAAQAHIVVATQLAPAALLAAFAVAWHTSGERQAKPQAKRQRWAVAGAIALGCVLWAPVVAQELSAGPSNLEATYESAEAPVARVGPAYAVDRLAAALGSRPLFTRTHGDALVMGDGDRGRVEVAMAVLGASGSLALAGRRTRGRRSAIALAALVSVAALGGLAATAQFPVAVAGERVDAMRWLWVLSAWAWLSIAWSAWRLAGPVRAARWAPLVLATGAVVVTAATVATLVSFDLRDVGDGAEMVAVGPAAAEAISHTAPGTYHLRFGDNGAYATVGAGIALLLDGSGRRIEVDPGPFTMAYGHDRRTTSDHVDGTLRVTTEPGAGPEANEVQIASARGGFDSAVVVKVFLSR